MVTGQLIRASFQHLYIKIIHFNTKIKRRCFTSSGSPCIFTRISELRTSDYRFFNKIWSDQLLNISSIELIYSLGLNYSISIILPLYILQTEISWCKIRNFIKFLCKICVTSSGFSWFFSLVEIWHSLK